MAEATRLAKLPGYDTAPDVYETPEVTDEQSTSTTTNDESSDSASTDTETANSEEDGPFGGISRRRLFPERARSRFQAVGSRIDAKGLDLSDRVDGRRRGLKVRQRRAGQENGGSESLEAKIARLRREVEECRIQNSQPSADNTGGNTAEINALSEMLADLESGKVGETTDHAVVTNSTTEHKTRAEEVHRGGQMLSRITAFDGRLTALEKALGLASMDIDSSGTFTAPVLPSLNLMDQQLSALMTSTSIMQLDAASSRIKKLSQEADQLAVLQATRPTQPTDDDESEDESAALSQDDLGKLNALYGLLPTLQGLSPTVPLMLERLKGLNALHTGAANAASDLDELAQKQAEMQSELDTWQEGLKRVETVIREALEANGRNGTFVKGWVDDLESRMQALR